MSFFIFLVLLCVSVCRAVTEMLVYGNASFGGMACAGFVGVVAEENGIELRIEIGNRESKEIKKKIIQNASRKSANGVRRDDKLLGDVCH